MNTSNSCKHQHNSKYIIIYHRREWYNTEIISLEQISYLTILITTLCRDGTVHIFSISSLLHKLWKL